MTTFHLTVVTPDGCAFEGQAERIVCRAIDGDIAILAKHGDYCTALGMGEAHIVDADGQRRRAACLRSASEPPKKSWSVRHEMADTPALQ